MTTDPREALAAARLLFNQLSEIQGPDRHVDDLPIETWGELMVSVLDRHTQAMALRAAFRKQENAAIASILKTPDIRQLLNDFRDLVHSGVNEALRAGGGGKSYEGQIDYSVRLAGVSEEAEKEGDCTEVHSLRLLCYVLGPSRSYEWTGTDVVELFARASELVRGWIAEEREDG